MKVPQSEKEIEQFALKFHGKEVKTTADAPFSDSMIVLFRSDWSEPKLTVKDWILNLHAGPRDLIASDWWTPTLNTWQAWIDWSAIDDSTQAKTSSDFPHECPLCHGPAYCGFLKIECKGGCR